MSASVTQESHTPCPYQEVLSKSCREQGRKSSSSTPVNPPRKDGLLLQRKQNSPVARIQRRWPGVCSEREVVPSPTDDEPRVMPGTISGGSTMSRTAGVATAVCETYEGLVADYETARKNGNQVRALISHPGLTGSG